MAAVLATPTAADILDNPEYDTILLAIWTFIAGGLYDSVGYFLVGFALFFGVRLLASQEAISLLVSLDDEGGWRSGAVSWPSSGPP